MSIDKLLDLERSIERGSDVYACPGLGRNQWIIGKSPEELRPLAKRAANQKKMAVQIVRLLSLYEAVTGQTFLVPTKIGEAGPRGEANIEWTVVETKEAAEMMRDVRHGPSPFFTMEIVETIEPNE